MPASELAATATLRKDTWWVEPLLIVLGLGGFVVYTTWAALQGAHFEYKNYLSPFYSPTLKPSWWPFSPAILILWGPARRSSFPPRALLSSPSHPPPSFSPPAPPARCRPPPPRRGPPRAGGGGRGGGGGGRGGGGVSVVGESGGGAEESR